MSNRKAHKGIFLAPFGSSPCAFVCTVRAAALISIMRSQKAMVDCRN